MKANIFKRGQKVKYLVTGEIVEVVFFTPATFDYFGDMLTPPTVTWFDSHGNKCWDTKAKFQEVL
jgi:hypothetical protein